MSVEWYLLNDKNNRLSGFEEIDNEGFSELLYSDIAEDVELFNYDLSERKEIKAIIQERMTDTKLKTLNRHALVPIGTLHAGMYIKYKDIYWLIVGIVDNNGIYEKAVMTFCNYYLTWVNKSGRIVQRWANVASASQYNNGETTTSHYYDRTDQLMVSMPDDDESLMLNSGERFIVDRRCKVYEKSFDESVTVNTNNPVIVYRLTRSDSVLYDYQTSGYFQFLIYQDEQQEQDGYYVIDGKGYWLCKNIMPVISDNISEIRCDSDVIYPDGFSEKFTGVFYSDSGAVEEKNPVWEVVSDFNDKLNVSYDDNSILISTSDLKLINKSFELILKCDGYEDVSKTIYVRAFI